LKKHYGLSGFIPQNNNYVIFDRFFAKNDKPKMPLSPKNSITKPAIHKIEAKDTKMETNSRKATSQGQNAPTEQTVSFKPAKDQTKSSFGCPWAVEEKVGFKTSSNAYGNHYGKR
jgi:hypothetical protein